MYDYVLMLGLDSASTKKIQTIKNHVRVCGFLDKQRGWPPHITVDHYNYENRNDFILKIDEVVKELKGFETDCFTLGKFSNGTLYIIPAPTVKFEEIKASFDAAVGEFKVPNKYESYTPHITICTNDNLEQSKVAALEKFNPFTARVSKVWLYTENMVLVKEWDI